MFNIGAAWDNNLVIDHDEYVSSHHAILSSRIGSLVIADRRSKNGTFVNGTRLGEMPMAVRVGDQIRMGQSSFEVAHGAQKATP